MIVNKLQELIKNEEIDALLLTGLENPVAAKNLHYITKYTGSYGFSIIGENYKYFVSDFRYKEQAQIEAPAFTFVEIEGSLIDALNSIVEKENIMFLGFDQKIRYSEFAMYQELSCELLPTSNLIEALRLSKSKDEVKFLKKACEITDEALKYALHFVKPGVKERDLEIIIKNKMIELGAESTWPRFIVASGERGSMPHGMASNKLIKDGELITFDIGCFYKGYSSDMTRTVAVGEINPQLRKIYNIVLEAQKRCLKLAKAGITGKELDSVCRDYISEAGYGENFKTGTGHGLGLDVHEGPRVSQKNDKPLELGACVTIEPGIYISGLGGVRIEDDIILTETGCIILNEFPKNLITLSGVFSK